MIFNSYHQEELVQAAQTLIKRLYRKSSNENETNQQDLEALLSDLKTESNLGNRQILFAKLNNSLKLFDISSVTFDPAEYQREQRYPIVDLIKHLVHITSLDLNGILNTVSKQDRERFMKVLSWCKSLKTLRISKLPSVDLCESLQELDLDTLETRSDKRFDLIYNILNKNIKVKCLHITTIAWKVPKPIPNRVISALAGNTTVKVRFFYYLNMIY